MYVFFLSYVCKYDAVLAISQFLHAQKNFKLGSRIAAVFLLAVFGYCSGCCKSQVDRLRDFCIVVLLGTLSRFVAVLLLKSRPASCAGNLDAGLFTRISISIVRFYRVLITVSNSR